jgi:hypothetical protein
MNDMLWIGMGVLVLVAGLLARRGERGRKGISDVMIRQIESTGRIDRDDVEPIDIDEIRSHEDEFWAQTWDEPESMGDPLGWEKPDGL